MPKKVVGLRDTKFKHWKAAGGSLLTPYALRSQKPDLYPYMETDTAGSGISWLAMMGCLPGLMGCAFLYMLFTGGFSGGGELPRQLQTATARAEATISAALEVESSPSPEAAQAATAIPDEDRVVLPQFNPDEHKPSLTPAPTQIGTLESIEQPSQQPQQRDPATQIAAAPTRIPWIGESSITPIQVRLAWFNPALEGSHCEGLSAADCATVAGYELAALENTYTPFAACPAELPIGSTVEVPGVGAWICLERLEIVQCHLGSFCDIAILGAGSRVDNWRHVYNANIYGLDASG